MSIRTEDGALVVCLVRRIETTKVHVYTSTYNTTRPTPIAVQNRCNSPLLLDTGSKEYRLKPATDPGVKRAKIVDTGFYNRIRPEATWYKALIYKHKQPLPDPELEQKIADREQAQFNDREAGFWIRRKGAGGKGGAYGFQKHDNTTTELDEDTKARLAEMKRKDELAQHKQRVALEQAERERYVVPEMKHVMCGNAELVGRVHV